MSKKTEDFDFLYEGAEIYSLEDFDCLPQLIRDVSSSKDVKDFFDAKAGLFEKNAFCKVRRCIGKVLEKSKKSPSKFGSKKISSGRAVRKCDKLFVSISFLNRICKGDHTTDLVAGGGETGGMVFAGRKSK